MPMTIQLDHLFTLRLQRDESRAFTIRNGPHGTRSIAAADEGGRFEGPRLSGRLATGTSGDWATFRQDGSFIIDARLMLVTDDEVPILMSYKGVGGWNDDRTPWMHTSPIFETAHEPHGWLNDVQGVARGYADGDHIVYEVFAIAGWEDTETP